MDVVGVGAVTWDQFLVVPRFPEPDGKMRAIQKAESAGGQVATALVALQRWGLACRFVGLLGWDDYSDRILKDLEEESIDITHLVRREDADGRRTTVLVDNRNGQRSIISGPHRTPPMQRMDFRDDLFTGARVLHIDTTVGDVALELVRWARSEGLLISLDAERVGQETEELLPLVDLIVADRHFAVAFTGETKLDLAAYALHLRSGGPVVVTDGPNGCEYVSADMQLHQDAFEVPVVDSTGAGDAFHAAYIYGHLAGWDIRRILRFSSWVASKVCEELGGRKGIPSGRDVHGFNWTGD